MGITVALLVKSIQENGFQVAHQKSVICAKVTVAVASSYACGGLSFLNQHWAI